MSRYVEPAVEQTKANLLAAADLLERDGWTQGVYHRPDGCHCALGAIGLATGYQKLGFDGDPEEDPADYFEEDEAPYYHVPYAGPERDADAHQRWAEASGRFEAASRALRNAVGVQLVPEWNDEPERTADEVIATLRATAAAL